MADIAMLLDPSKCTACRGCQAACKLWNKRDFVSTVNTGTYENPPKLGKDGPISTLLLRSRSTSLLSIESPSMVLTV